MSVIVFNYFHCCNQYNVMGKPDVWKKSVQYHFFKALSAFNGNKINVFFGIILIYIKNEVCVASVFTGFS